MFIAFATNDRYHADWFDLFGFLLFLFWLPGQVFESITNELDSKLAAATVRGGGEGGRVVEKATAPMEGMKPGTSGLRKKVG